MVTLPGPPPPEPKAIRGDAVDRADQAWRLRVAGASWPQVAQVVGFADAPTAQRAVRNCYGTSPEVDREELRGLWRERLEALWRQTLKDATEQRAGATTAGVRVAQAATVLDGLNAPTEVVVHPSTAEIEAFVSRLRAAETQWPVEVDIITGEVESGSVD